MHDISPLALNRKLNFRPSMPSINALRLFLPRLSDDQLPLEVDLENEFTPCYDQLQIGSCVDNAVGALIERQINITNYKYKFRPSRLFLYYNARMREGTVDSDSGSTITDCVAAANEYGVCPEIEGDGTSPDWLWPYIDNGIAFKTKPSDQCYKDAVLHKVLQDQIVSLDANTVLNALAARKPFAFGFTVHKSFMSQQTAQTGIMKVPSAWDILDPTEGGHGVDAIGYKLNTPMGDQGIKDWVKVRNSWATNWGQKGYFWMPLNEILCNPNVSCDAHTVDLVGL